MRKLEKYPHYKESGVEWLGEIPQEWEVKKLKYLVNNLNNRRIPIESTLRGRMLNRIYDYYGATGVIDKVDSYIFDEPTIILAEDGANLLLRNIKLVYLAEGKYWVNNHAHILKTNNSDDKHLIAYLLETVDYTTLISGAAQPKLTKEKLMNISLPIPPISAQIAITSFLDTKTEQLDTAIKQKEQLIELLKERRQILIHDAVTKGIDSTAKMKESGVEWIGKIPEHWEVRKLKTFTSFINRGSTPSYVEKSDVYIINQATFSKGFFDFKNIKYTNETVETFTKDRGRVFQNRLLAKL